MQMALIKKRHREEILKKYTVTIAGMSKEVLKSEWDKVRKELNPNCEVACTKA